MDVVGFEDAGEQGLYLLVVSEGFATCIGDGSNGFNVIIEGFQVERRSGGHEIACFLEDVFAACGDGVRKDEDDGSDEQCGEPGAEVAFVAAAVCQPKEGEPTDPHGSDEGPR